MADLQHAKRVVLDYYADLDSLLRGNGSVDDVASVLRKHTTDDYSWRGMHPFYEQEGADSVAEVFWRPTIEAFSPLQRRADVFLAGESVVEGREADVWVCQMGHLLGLFDAPWLHIPPTHKMVFVRYAEFHRVVGDQIAETALFVDVLSVMRQAGHYPLPPQTGLSLIHI